MIAGAYFSYFLVSKIPIYTSSTYQNRDITRAIEIYSDKILLWFGPEMSGGGHLPGPFYYYLIGLPIYIFEKIAAVAWLEVILAALAMAAICNYLHRKVSKESGQIFCLLFLSSTFFYYQLLLFWNPSFLLIFAAAAYILLDQKPGQIGWAVFGMIIGVSLQIHFSMVFFILIAIVIILTDISSPKTKLYSFAALSSALLMTLAPYLIFRTQLGWADDPNLNFMSAAQRILFKIQRAYNSLTQLRNDKLVDVLVFAVRDPIIFMFFPSIFVANKWRVKIKQHRTLFVGLIIYFPMLVLLIAGLYLLRYQIQFILLAGIFVSIVMGEIFKKSKTIKTAVITICLIHLAINMSSQNFENISHIAGDVDAIVTTKEAEQIFAKINEITGWSFDELRQKTFRVGFDRDESWRIGYNEVIRNSGLAPKKVNFDGLLVVNGKQENLSLSLGGSIDFKKVLEPNKNSVPEEVYKAVSSDLLVCREMHVIAEKYFLCFYSIPNKSGETLWSNLGNSYFETQNRLQSNGVAKNATEFAEDLKQVHLRYNSCPQKPASCEIEFVFDFSRLPDILFRINGVPLSVVDPEHNPYRTFSLNEPVLTLNCGGKISRTVLVSKLGISMRGNENFVAPFASEFKSSCKDFAELSSAKVNVESGLLEIVSSAESAEFQPIEIEYSFR